MYKILLLLLFPLYANAQIITSIAGNGIGGYTGDGGPATAAEIGSPIWVNINDSQCLFISDYENNVIRKITPSGIISTFAGNGHSGYNGDGGPATLAQLSSPSGVVFDKNGNAFIADWGNNCIRKINSDGIITTIAGTGNAGYSGDGGPATDATLDLPINLAFDVSGNLYIADHYNHVVRKVDTAGIISTYAGTGTQGYSGDNGPATTAEFYFPFGLAFDIVGNLCIADEGNAVIRKVDAFGIVTTIAGNGIHGYTGDNVAATATALWAPSTLAFDKIGDMYIADDDNYRVRKINTQGIITTIAGNGTSGFTGDGGPAVIAELGYPEGVTIDNCGNLYIADVYFKKIRKVSFNPYCWPENVSNVSATNNEIKVYPNPATTEVTIETAPGLSNGKMIMYNMLGQVVLQKNINTEKTILNIANLPNGVYFLEIDDETTGQRITKKILKE